MSYRTCQSCGWVHVMVSRETAEQYVAEFNAYFDTLPPDNQTAYYRNKKTSISCYERCFHCGGSYKNFREFLFGDCPEGVTIQPILGDA